MTESVENLNRFLSSTTKDDLLSKTDSKTFHIVIGNEASDMDSIVSSIAFAFYKNSSTGDKDNVYVPIINIPREDFALRTETTWIFSQLHIPTQSLLFYEGETITALDNLQSSNRLRVILTDHNRLAGHQEKWAPIIEEIVDHHKDEQLYNPSKRTIAMVGSACSLVTEIILNDSNNTVFSELGPAKLLLGAILIDSVGGKETPKDTEMIAALSKLLGYSETQRKEYLAKLQEERFNVSSSGTSDLLRADYKQWKMGKIECGISSAKRSIAEWLQKDKDNFALNLDKFAQERKLDVLMVMTVHQDEKKQLHRELVIHTLNKHLYDVTVEYLLTKTNLQLKPSEQSSALYNTNGRNIGFFEQLNITASRKQLQPIVDELYNNIN